MVTRCRACCRIGFHYSLPSLSRAYLQPNLSNPSIYPLQIIAFTRDFSKRETVPTGRSYLFSGGPPGSGSRIILYWPCWYFPPGAPKRFAAAVPSGCTMLTTGVSRQGFPNSQVALVFSMSGLLLRLPENRNHAALYSALEVNKRSALNGNVERYIPCIATRK